MVGLRWDYTVSTYWKDQIQITYLELDEQGPS